MSPVTNVGRVESTGLLGCFWGGWDGQDGDHLVLCRASPGIGSHSYVESGQGPLVQLGKLKTGELPKMVGLRGVRALSALSCSIGTGSDDPALILYPAM